MAFEQLMAESMKKQEKKKEKDGHNHKDKDKEPHKSHFGHSQTSTPPPTT
jgi:hypothetical protein